MYLWLLNIHLKNGKSVSCYYETNTKSPHKIINEKFCGEDNIFVGFEGGIVSDYVFVVTEEVACVELTLVERENDERQD